jgi:hypothetical protein
MLTFQNSLSSPGQARRNSRSFVCSLHFDTPAEFSGKINELRSFVPHIAPLNVVFRSYNSAFTVSSRPDDHRERLRQV